MTKEQRTKCRAALRELCDATEERKSTDYAKEEDTLSNFKEMAHFTGTTKYQAWLVYFGKHMTTIINSIRRSPEMPQVESEPIKTRIVDAIVYLQILDYMIEEDVAARPRIGRPRKALNLTDGPNGGGLNATGTPAVAESPQPQSAELVTA